MVYTNKPFLSDVFMKSYNSFINTVFNSYNAMGVDAKLKTKSSEHKIYFTGDKILWERENWDQYFFETEPDNQQKVSEAYYAFLEVVAKEISPGDPPRDFDKDIERDIEIIKSRPSSASTSIPE